MDRVLPEIMQQRVNAQHDVIRNDSGTDMSVLERQQVHMKWQQGQFQEQQLINYINGNDDQMSSMFPIAAQAQPFRGFIGNDQGLDELVNQAMKQDSGEQNGWSDQFGNNMSGLSYCSGGIVNKGSGYDMNCAIPIPRTISCPPAVAEAMVETAVATGKGKEVTKPEKLSYAVGRESFRKRKVDKSQCQKVNTTEETKDKKMKGNVQESDSKITEQHTSNNSNTDPSADTSKENSKVTEVQKLDYIHVRARRGQATDSHSLAERVRREKISERMKYLQDLVPGCNKIVGKAGMLDEIINYVQSLQRQVEFLSMKLAAVNPTIDFDLESLFIKEIIQAGASDFATIGSSTEMATPVHLQFNPLQQIVACSGMETVVNSPDMALRRTISAPVTLPETLLDPSCFNQLPQSSTCEAELQNLYAMEFQQGKSASYFSQPFTGYIEASHVKLQM